MKLKITIITLASICIVVGVAACTTTGSRVGNTTSSAQPVGASSVKPYSLDTCVVTDNRLGSMGDPVRLVHNSQEMKFCCKPCVKKFKTNPDKYLFKLS